MKKTIFLLLLVLVALSGCVGQIVIGGESYPQNMDEFAHYNDNITDEDVRLLGGIPDLTSVYFSSRGVTDFSPLGSLPNLTSLSLIECGISDIGVFGSFTELTRLNLDGNEVADLSPLATLVSLEYLSIENNNVSDLTPLYGLENLGSLWVEGNPVPQEQIDAMKDVLPNCDIYQDAASGQASEETSAAASEKALLGRWSDGYGGILFFFGESGEIAFSDDGTVWISDAHGFPDQRTLEPNSDNTGEWYAWGEDNRFEVYHIYREWKTKSERETWSYTYLIEGNTLLVKGLDRAGEETGAVRRYRNAGAMQGESGVEINLNAQDAVLHGELSIAEEQDEQGYSIGGWQAGNKATWNVTVEEGGCYDFYVDYSAPFETFAEEGVIEISGIGMEERQFFDLMPTNGSVGGNAQLVDYEEYPANYLHLEQGEYQISVCPSRDEALSDDGDGYNNFLKLRGVRLVKAD